MKIEDHSSGIVAGVTKANQLRVVAESLELQHYISWYDEDVYQVISVDTGITAKTQTGLHIRNDDPAKNCAITFIRCQSITNPSHPLASDYFEIGVGRTVASGGTAATPVNMNQTSGKTASVTVTGIDPTMAGTFTQIDRQYIEADGREYSFEKQGSIILGLNDTFEIRNVCSGTGEAKYRVTFCMIPNDR